jgi:hypothetical protein
MDPITAINQEFVQRVRADWSRTAAEQRSERTTPAPHRQTIERLRARAYAAWVVFGGWLKAQERRVGHLIARRIG